MVYAIPDASSKIGIRYHDPVIIGGPLELLACQGVIGQTEEGTLSVHLHGLFSDATMKVYGGHFLVGGNPVLATVEILIQESSDVRMIREQDEETGFLLFKFYQSDRAYDLYLYSNAVCPDFKKGSKSTATA